MLTEGDDSCSITKIYNGFSELTVGLEQNGEQNNHDTLKKFIKKDMFVKATHPTFGKTSNIGSLIAPQNNLLEKQNTYQ